MQAVLYVNRDCFDYYAQVFIKHELIFIVQPNTIETDEHLHVVINSDSDLHVESLVGETLIAPEN